ncbi:hypothetical protein, partial [Brucella melitensis]|uniref:hypothetical protein n=1 Tax=Brucella melitensis TaxID=29459 RepID=UPI001AEDCD94
RILFPSIGMRLLTKANQGKEAAGMSQMATFFARPHYSILTLSRSGQYTFRKLRGACIGAAS